MEALRYLTDDEGSRLLERGERRTYAADEAIRQRIRDVWRERGFEVLRLIAVWSGPGRVILAMKVRPPEGEKDAIRLVERMNEAELAVRSAVPEIAFSFVEPDVTD